MNPKKFAKIELRLSQILPRRTLPKLKLLPPMLKSFR